MPLRKHKTVLPSNIFAVSKRPHKTLRKRSFFHKKIIFLDVLSDVSKHPYMMQKERSFVKETKYFFISFYCLIVSVRETAIYGILVWIHGRSLKVIYGRLEMAII